MLFLKELMFLVVSVFILLFFLVFTVFKKTNIILLQALDLKNHTLDLKIKIMVLKNQVIELENTISFVNDSLANNQLYYLGLALDVTAVIAVSITSGLLFYYLTMSSNSDLDFEGSSTSSTISELDVETVSSEILSEAADSASILHNDSNTLSNVNNNVSAFSNETIGSPIVDVSINLDQNNLPASPSSSYSEMSLSDNLGQFSEYLLKDDNLSRLMEFYQKLNTLSVAFDHNQVTIIESLRSNIFKMQWLFTRFIAVSQPDSCLEVERAVELYHLLEPITRDEVLEAIELYQIYNEFYDPITIAVPIIHEYLGFIPSF